LIGKLLDKLGDLWINILASIIFAGLTTLVTKIGFKFDLLASTGIGLFVFILVFSIILFVLRHTAIGDTSYNTSETEQFVSAEEAKAMLRVIPFSSDALEYILDVADKIQSELSGKDITDMLSKLNSTDCAIAFQALVPKLRYPLTQTDIQFIQSMMQRMHSSDAKQVATALGLSLS
jgi:hypothetical protein